MCRFLENYREMYFLEENGLNHKGNLDFSRSGFKDWMYVHADYLRHVFRSSIFSLFILS